MKKSILPLLFASGAMFITGCSNVNADVTTNEPHSDLLENDTRNANLVKPHRHFAGEDVKEYDYPDEVKIHYHRDDNKYSDKRFWLWSPLKGDDLPEREFEMEKDTETPDNWSKVLKFNPKELFGSEKADGFSFIIKDAGTWNGQSPEFPILYSKYKPITADGKTTLDIYITHTGTKVSVFPSLQDAMSDRVDIAFISKDLKKINIYCKDGTLNNEAYLKQFKIYKFNEAYQGFTDSLKETKKPEYLLYSSPEIAKSEKKDKVAVQFEKPLTINCQYVIESTFWDKDDRINTYSIGVDNLYSTPKFQELNYRGELGAKVIHNEDGSAKTVFKLWAPTAYKVRLKIYNENGDAATLDETKYGIVSEMSAANSYYDYDMKLNLKDAVWEYEFPENLDGKYYTYKVWNSSGINDNVVDPYAISAGMNGKRGMVTDMTGDEVTPEGWNDLPLKWDGTERDIVSSQELAISEVHIRDLTMHETWSDREEDQLLRGTFNGFTKEGTKYTKGNTTVATGYDHLVDYGVNAIQLLPIFDQDNAERAMKEITITNAEGVQEKASVHDYDKLDDFNWGYNPQNYNVVEGSYSSNPRDGHLRVKELRNLVQKFATNKNKTRIIMDVVYNHMSSAPQSSFEKIMPKYSFRYLPDGSLSNASGCGNEVKTDAPMMRKFIVDSMKMWATEYKIKGFRFDLMGAIDVKTLAVAADELYKIDPDIVLYGEGWYAGDKPPRLPADEKAVNDNIDTYLNPGRDADNYEGRYPGHGYVGGFNNGLRDSLKGDNGINNDGAFRGFIGGNKDDYQLTRIKAGLMGANFNNEKSMSFDPRQNISYVSCHDNFTLFDQLKWLTNTSDSSNDKHNKPELEPADTTVAQASVAVNGMVLMSNSASFINGGEEIFRTKIVPEGLDLPKTDEEKGFETKMYGKRVTHNSYKNDDIVNAYNYERKADLVKYYEMYKDLVAIKKDLVFDQSLVNKDTFDVGNKDIINIETSSTGNNKIGIYRKGKTHNYHAYLLSTDGPFDIEPPAASTNRFNNIDNSEEARKKIVPTGGKFNTSNWYGLYIFEE